MGATYYKLKPDLTGYANITPVPTEWECQERSIRMKKYWRKVKAEKEAREAREANAIATSLAEPVGENSSNCSSSYWACLDAYNLRNNVEPISSVASGDQPENESLSEIRENSNDVLSSGSEFNDDICNEIYGTESDLVHNYEDPDDEGRDSASSYSHDEAFDETDNLNQYPSGTGFSKPINNNEINQPNNLIQLNAIKDYKPETIYNDDGTVTINNNKTKLGRKKRNADGITKKQRKAIKGLTLFLERKNHRSNIALDTLTLPDMDKDDEYNVALNEHEILNRCLDDFKYYFDKNNMDMEYVCVKEISEKALFEEGRIKFHSHITIVNKRGIGGNWIITPEINDRVWQANVNKFTKKHYEIKANRLEKVRKDLSGYMSKLSYYLSKGSEKAILKIKEMGMEELLPSSWYIASRKLKQEVKQWVIDNTIEFDYYGGMKQLITDLSNSWKRRQIEGLIDKFDHSKQIKYADRDDSRILSITIFFSVKYLDEISNNMLIALARWNYENMYGESLPV